MGKPAFGVIGRDGGEGVGDRLQEGGLGACFGGAQESFDLAPHQFDGVQIRRVGGQKPGLRTDGGDQSEGGFVFMGPEIVQHDDVARAQGRHEDFPHVGLEDLGVGRPFDGHAGARAVQADGGDHRGGLPMAVRTARHQTLAARGSSAQARHVCFGRRFVDEDEPARLEAALFRLPLLLSGGDIGPVLFGRVERLPLYVSPSASRA